MVDILALALSHGLLALAAWRLMMRGDLDADPVPAEVPEPAPAPVPRKNDPRALRR